MVTVHELYGSHPQVSCLVAVGGRKTDVIKGSASHMA